MAVVVFHLRLMEQLHRPGDVVLPAAFDRGFAGVDLFFVISGLVMAIVSGGTYGSLRQALRFAAKRAWRILPPYWFYTTLLVAPMLFLPGVLAADHDLHTVVASYLLLPQNGLPVLMVGWTLVHEAYFYLVMALAIAFLPERYAGVFLGAWGLVVLLVRPGPGASPWLQLVFNPMALEFIAGAYIGFNWRRLAASVWPKACLLASAPIGIWLLFYMGGNAADLAAEARVLLFGLPSVVLVLAATGLPGLRESRRAWLGSLGDASYSIYLSHPFVLSIAGRYWRSSGEPPEPWHHAVSVLLVLAACVVVGLVSHRLLERPVAAFGKRFRMHKPQVA